MKPATPFEIALFAEHLREVMSELQTHLTPEMRPTFAARHPTMPEAFVLSTTDDLPALADFLLQQHERPKGQAA